MARLTSRPVEPDDDTDGGGPQPASQTRPQAVVPAQATIAPDGPTASLAGSEVRVRLAAVSQLVDDPTHRVAVLAQRQAVVDGSPVDATLRDLGGGRHVLEDAGGRTRVVLEPRRRSMTGSDIREVLVDGFRFEVEVEPERRAALRERATRGRAVGEAGGPLEVRAVIPGKVVAVSVAEGDRVSAGQQLLVVEAMKMQNELRAPRDGTIARVGVAEGLKIEIGDLLVVISQEVR